MPGGCQSRRRTSPIISDYLAAVGGCHATSGPLSGGPSQPADSSISAGDLADPGQAAEEVAGHATVDHEIVAVDVAGVGAEEERDHVGHVLGG